MTRSELSIRVDLTRGGRFGPGKAALLKAIAETGSIQAAASHLGMSYPKALKLIEQLHTDFVAPLIESKHGGNQRGGSQLTAEGRRILALYERICDLAQAAVDAELQELDRHLKSD